MNWAKGCPFAGFRSPESGSPVRGTGFSTSSRATPYVRQNHCRYSLVATTYGSAPSDLSTYVLRGGDPARSRSAVARWASRSRSRGTASGVSGCGGGHASTGAVLGEELAIGRGTCRWGAEPLEDLQVGTAEEGPLRRPVGELFKGLPHLHPLVFINPASIHRAPLMRHKCPIIR